MEKRFSTSHGDIPVAYAEEIEDGMSPLPIAIGEPVDGPEMTSTVNITPANSMLSTSNAISSNGEWSYPGSVNLSGPSWSITPELQGAGYGGGSADNVKDPSSLFLDAKGALVFAGGIGRSLYDVCGALQCWCPSKEYLAYRKAEAETSGWSIRCEFNNSHEGSVTCAWAGASNAPRTLLTGGKDKLLYLWQEEDGGVFQRSTTLRGHTDWVNCCALAPGADCAVSGGRDGSLRFWMPSVGGGWARSGAIGASWAAKGVHGNWSGDVGGAGMHGPADTGGEGQGPPWHESARVDEAHGSSEFITCCALKGGGQPDWVATGGTDWVVQLWDIAKARSLGRLSFRGHSYPVRCLATSSSGSLLVSGGEDKKVVVWNPNSRRAVVSLNSHMGTVMGVAVDPAHEGGSGGGDPRWVATGGEDGFLFVWDPRQWKKPIATLRGNKVAGLGEVEGGDSMRHRLGRASGGGQGGEEEAERKQCEGRGGGSNVAMRWEGETAGATMIDGLTSLAASPDGETLFAAGERDVWVWKRAGGMWEEAGVLPSGCVGGVLCLSVMRPM